jgi:hypothetical protein
MHHDRRGAAIAAASRRSGDLGIRMIAAGGFTATDLSSTRRSWRS